MIGTVTFNTDAGRMTAVLQDDFAWTCAERPAIAERLNTLQLPWRERRSPSLGNVGMAMLADAAKRLRGTVYAEPQEEDIPGTIY